MFYNFILYLFKISRLINDLSKVGINRHPSLDIPDVLLCAIALLTSRTLKHYPQSIMVLCGILNRVILVQQKEIIPLPKRSRDIDDKSENNDVTRTTFLI